jgi:hypothetical protein
MVGVHSAEMNSKLDAVTGAELELLKLVRRHLETFGRGSSLYRHVERAGYLVLRTLEALASIILPNSDELLSAPSVGPQTR